MIFEDPTARRGRLVGVAGLALAAISSATIGLIAMSALVVAELPALPPALQTVGDAGDVSVEKLDDATDAVAPPSQPAATSSASALTVTAKTVPAPAEWLGGPEFLNAAFVLQDEQMSVASLRAHLKNLQIVFPDWMSFADASGALSVNVNRKLADQLRAAGVKILPRVSNTDVNGEWFENGLSEFLRDAGAANAFRDRLLATLAENKADGINIDIESLHAQDGSAYVDWLARLTDAMHARGYLVAVDVPMNDEAYDYQAIGRLADAVVLMAYDEHWSTSSAGPIASRPWYEGGVDQATKRINPKKLIAGVGAYAYDWTAGVASAQALGFDETLALAERHDARIEAAGEDVNSHFQYVDNAGRDHDVWMLDAISAWNQYLYARRAGLRGAALWRAGLEEPQFWSFFGSPTAANFDPRTLSRALAGETVRIEGEGELLRVREGRRDGERNLDASDGFIDWARYETLPRSFKVQRFGEGDPKKIALTFDDGPDPTWTPQILRVLSKYGAPATFFLIGENVQRIPRLVHDEVETGHLVGNHTYSHPDLLAISKERLWSELRAGQRQIEAAAGRSTLLFRAPYDNDSAPTNAAQLAPLEDVDRMGYLVAEADVDAQDYRRPGADAIFANVMNGLAATGGRIVVFHDGGGDRTQTVEAVDRLIPALRAAGYEIVPLNALVGVPPAALNPDLSLRERLLSFGARILSWAGTYGAEAIIYIFAVTTAISVLRIVFLGALVAQREHRRAADGPSDFEPPVCVLIPAFNEARVIGCTIEAALASDYKRLRILVIDDGSVDHTASVVEAWAARDPRVSLVRQRNAGKAAALNRGARAAEEEILVTIDADTFVLRHTISSLVKPFADPSVDAVCGNVQVGNVCNLLTEFQSVEYVTSQNYDRRAFDSLNCISVVPGATGAWRRRALLAVGGYSADTLTEDADLTLTMLGAGGRITYAPLAKSVTEAPQTVATLFRQRFRWSYGTLQCLWKHRRRFGRGALGWVALPNVAIQLLFPLLAPVVAFVVLLALLRLDFRPVAVGYAAFLALDLVAPSVAFRLDRRPLRDIWVVIVQRFLWRPFLYFVTFAVVLAALRGARQRWNKLARTGAVDVAPLQAAVEAPGAIIRGGRCVCGACDDHETADGVSAAGAVPSAVARWAADDPPAFCPRAATDLWAEASPLADVISGGRRQ
jgi:cellulose synthase/poly-beta-1,6-N-acetylglucosamine synthase-like glycosyltransferase/spore germination protein YaaH/peptidoglycan/xylan/chitin deacetylase (PgdA/CDA1 family)